MQDCTNNTAYVWYINNGVYSLDTVALSSNLLKVKTKWYEAISSAEINNAQVYDATLDISKDKPSGTIIAILVTPSTFNGYDSAGTFASVFNDVLYLSCLKPNWNMRATVIWLYI